jgi:glutathione S-transferase
VATRTVLFSELIHEPGYICRVFSEGKPRAAQLLYRASFPLVKGLVAKGNGLVDPGGVERAYDVTRRALDLVARATESTGYLVGDAFGIADLTCAALLAVLTDPPHPDMHRPGPMPERVAALLARFASHPAMQWVQEQYRTNRPPRTSLAA